MNRAIFLDRDGTINIEKGYLHKVEEFHFEDKVIEALKKVSGKGFKLIVLTSQSGIGRGYYTEADYQNLMDHMFAELYKEGIVLDGAYFCPHHKDEAIGRYKVDCNCRKPKPGLVLKACQDHDIDPSLSYVIGDCWRDIKMGVDAGCTSILVTTGKAGKDVEHMVDGIMIKENLLDAVNYILENENKN